MTLVFVAVGLVSDPAKASAQQIVGTVTQLSGAVQVPANASSLTLSVTDSSGALVNQFSVAPGTGLQGFTWNGTTSTGAAAPPGTYNFAASVTVGGSSQAAATLLDGTVASVSLGTGGAGVTLNTPELGPVALSSVQQIN